jgi:hypothetical protein
VTKTRRSIYLVLIASFAAAMVIFGVLYVRHRAAAGVSGGTAAAAPVSAAPVQSAGTPIDVYAHNILLRKGPNFKIYIRWIRGQMAGTKRLQNPSLDDSSSFVLEIQKGLLFAQIADVARFLDNGLPADSPLKKVSLVAKDDGQLQLKGTVHKVVPLPVGITGQLSSTADYRIRFHVTKIEVLKVPMKGLLGVFHIQLSELANVKDVPGVEISGNDILFDTEKLLPAPHIHGPITSVRVAGPNIEVVYGVAPVDSEKLAQWHNFLRLRNGTLDFGKLTMHQVDLTLIDATKSPWFDLDLVNYQAQLVNGYTRVTPAAGMEIYMPAPSSKSTENAQQSVSLQWLKDRNTVLPAGVPK